MQKSDREIPKPSHFPALECGLAFLVTAAAIALHLVFMFHAGAPWRDEINEINLAAMPTLRDAWAHDSFPVLWIFVLRIWSSLGLGSDSGLRLLGCLIGLASIGILWFAARRLKFKIPFFSLLLLGYSSSMIRWGDSIRPWGLAIALILLTFALVWSVVESPTRKNFLFATMAAVASVQCIYYNAILLLAICAGVFVVTLRNRSWKALGLVFGIGLIAALSLLPYIGTVNRAMDVYLVMQQPSFDVGTFCEKISDALAPADEFGKFGVWLWTTLAFGSVMLAFFCQIRPSIFKATPAQKNLLLFSVTTLIVGVVAYFLFLQRVRLATQAWYYIALMAVAALAIDAILSVLANHKAGRIFRGIVVVGAIGVTFFPVLKQVHSRQTNVDVLANELKKVAGQNDLILVNPWYAGLSFDRYYKGATPWMTIPPMDDHKTHRYDLIKSAMMMPDQNEPMRPVLEKIADTLKSGARVWLVGGVHLMSPDELAGGPPKLPPAPNSPSGWADTEYYEEWSQQAAFFLQEHAPRIEKYNPPLEGPVSEQEFVGMGFAEGWREKP